MKRAPTGPCLVYVFGDSATEAITRVMRQSRATRRCTLTVTAKGGKVLGTKVVQLTYDPVIGPDPEDIAEFKRVAAEIINGTPTNKK